MICAPDPNIVVMRGPNSDGFIYSQFSNEVGSMIRSQLRIKKIENIFKFKSDKYGGIDW